MDQSQSPYRLKLMIDSQSNSLLYAEAGKDCVDFLFYILHLPVDKILPVIVGTGVMNIVRNLHQSLGNLEHPHMLPNYRNKDHVPPYVGPSLPLLGIKQDLVRCESCRDIVLSYCPCCRNTGYRNLYLPPEDLNIGDDSYGVAKGGFSYVISDDLVVTPLSSQSLINVFKNVKDLNAVQAKEVIMGQEEAVKIVSAMFKSVSKTILTDVFLIKTEREDMFPLLGDI